MSVIQVDDRKASLVFVGDFNALQSEWSASSSAISHGWAAMNFVNVSGCCQLESGPTHLTGICFDLLFTYVSDVMNVTALAPLESSDYSFSSLEFKLRQSSSSSMESVRPVTCRFTHLPPTAWAFRSSESPCKPPSYPKKLSAWLLHLPQPWLTLTSSRLPPFRVVSSRANSMGGVDVWESWHMPI